MPSSRQIFTGLTAGYIVFNRSFSYVGVPGWGLFLGEIVLATFLLTRSRVVFWLLRRVFRPLQRPLLLALMYGLFEICLGLVKGHPIFDVMRDSAFYYYTLYLVFGAFLCQRSRDSFVAMKKLAMFLALVNGVYGIAYVVALNNFLDVTIPGTPGVSVFPQPSGSPVVLIMLLSLFELKGKILALFVLNLLVLLAVQVRAEWMGFIVGVCTIAVTQGNARIIIRPLGLVMSILFLAYALDLSFPAPVTRGGEISVRGIVGRILAPVAPETAAHYSEYAEQQEGTFIWRVMWWVAILERSVESPDKFLVGNALGYDLAGLVDYGESSGLGGLRTPHNVLAYAIGYVGIIGLFLFLNLQWRLLKCFLKYSRSREAYVRSTGQLAVSLLLTWVTIGGFTSVFEAPYGAIPYYMVLGFLFCVPLSLKGKPLQIS